MTMATVRPLEGVRILDLTHVLAGPYATLFLAQAGAEIIKIERPGVGELSRRHLVQAADGRTVDHTMAYLNRGKKGLTLDLRSDEGRQIFLDLVAVSDVVVENFTPRTMRRLGLDYETLAEVNPRLIYTSVSGFGHDDVYQGPYTERPAFNLIAQAMGGTMDITGELGGPPVPTGVALGDLVAGVFAVSGTLMALRHRDVTGLGQHVDIAMYDTLASFSQRALLRYHLTGDLPTRGRDSRENPMGAFEVADGFVVMTTMGDAMWERLCGLLGRPDLLDDPDLTPDTARGFRYETVVRPILEEWARERTRDEVVELFRGADLPAAPVQSVDDLLQCPQLRARRMVYEVDDPTRGRLAFTGNPIKLSRLPEEEPASAPALGEHTDEVLAKLLDLDADRLAALRAGHVI